MVEELILDRFRLHHRLGSGGFGTVYSAWDERLERPVAVKVIEAAPQKSRRVLREAQAAARLNHPGIVTLYELGEEDGRSYLVSELVEGATLAELRSEGSLSDRDVADLGVDLCEALAHAHSSGVVHRDIKPQNILVCETTERAKLMDFGIARLVDGAPLTATGDVIGTIAYMAPEQADGGDVGSAADVYSLALTLYEAWAGANPVQRSTPAATARAIGSPIRPLAAQRADLPRGLCAAIDSCLDARPAMRPTTAELGTELADAAPELDDVRPVPRQRAPLAGLIRVLGNRAVRASLSGLAVACLALAALLSTDASKPAYVYGLAALAGLITTRLPRLGFTFAAGGLAVWLAAGADQPGAAFAVGALCAPVALALPLSGRLWSAPALAPLLGLAGLGPLFPAVAGLCRSPARRVVLALLGYCWLVAAESALGTNLLIGSVHPAAAGWQQSVSKAASELLLPLFGGTVLLGALLWAGAAFTLGLLVRGRMIVLDLLGALVWSAGVIAAHRLLAGPGTAAGILPAAWLGAAILVSVAIALAWRTDGGPPVRRGHLTLS